MHDESDSLTPEHSLKHDFGSCRHHSSSHNVTALISKGQPLKLMLWKACCRTWSHVRTEFVRILHSVCLSLPLLQPFAASRGALQNCRTGAANTLIFGLFMVILGEVIIDPRLRPVTTDSSNSLTRSGTMVSLDLSRRSKLKVKCGVGEKVKR
jgi:hypothetical protein